MRIFLIVVFLLSPLHLLMAQKPDAVAVTCDFLEKVPGSEWQVVDSRSFLPPFNTPYQFSMANFSYDLTATPVNDTVVKIDSRVSAFDFSERNYFDSHTMTLGAAAFFDSALVRDSAVCRIRLRVDSLVKLGDVCEYSLAGEDFKFDPSGDFDFYYIPGSLGDWHWNEIRDVVEQNYDLIRARIDLFEPTKINFYISPCELPDIGWDNRWGTALDLARNNVYIQYSHGINTIQVESVFMIKLLRLWGYAPAVVLEGASSLVEFCDMYAQDYWREGTLPHISDLGISKYYRALDRRQAAYSAGSFVRFLIVTRGISKFESFYRRVTDLTYKRAFQDVYNQPITDVEKEWTHYLDTLNIPPTAYVLYRNRSQSLMKYDETMLYISRELQITGDTLHAGPLLANLYYYFGQYEDAEKIFAAVVRDEGAEPIAKSYLANIMLIEGKVDQADSLYRLALAEDTTHNYQPEYKLGIIAQYRGKNREALHLFGSAREKTRSIPIGVDINIAQGDSYYALGLRDSARVFYQAALDTAKILLGDIKDKPLFRLRVARAAVRLGEGANALDQLHTEFFIEERMYYIGEILLTMGQAYDLLGERKMAQQQYRKLFLYPTAFLDQELAEKYMRTPYHRN
jgi:tetratricopeptide (TPR) repeat protein